MAARLSHTRIAELPTECPTCPCLSHTRAFCASCAARLGLPACWRCGDKGWSVQEGRWGRCPCKAGDLPRSL